MTSPAVYLRRAEASDLNAILSLERATEYAPHWSPAVYAEILAVPVGAATERCLFVAQNASQTDAALVGFAVGWVHPATDSVDRDGSERFAELESVAVADNARRRGIGRALCRAVFDWCRLQGANEIVLEVRAGSEDAVALYASLGFVQTGGRPRYYRDPDDDALLLRLRLQ
jgi:ribosomal protein S18 acetylase RimI-like enzyme